MNGGNVPMSSTRDTVSAWKRRTFTQFGGFTLDTVRHSFFVCSTQVRVEFRQGVPSLLLMQWYINVENIFLWLKHAGIITYVKDCNAYFSTGTTKVLENLKLLKVLCRYFDRCISGVDRTARVNLAVLCLQLLVPPLPLLLLLLLQRFLVLIGWKWWGHIRPSMSVLTTRLVKVKQVLSCTSPSSSQI